MKELKVKYLDNYPSNAPKLEIPREGDIGIDIFSAEEVIMYPKEVKLIKTGISIEPPEGYWLQILDRSSVSKYSHVMAGILDEGYKGEVLIRMHCLKTNSTILKEVTSPLYSDLPLMYRPIGPVPRIESDVPVFHIREGDKIAQLIIRKNYNKEFVIKEVEGLSTSDRNIEGFGSTGE